MDRILFSVVTLLLARLKSQICVGPRRQSVRRPSRVVNVKRVQPSQSVDNTCVKVCCES